MSIRGEFSSRIGFILSAAGSAVGLGNICGFPTKVSENGGSGIRGCLRSTRLFVGIPSVDG